MKALSLWQFWASAIALWQFWASAIALDLKKIETRSWSTDYRGRLAIHAAKRWTRAERVQLQKLKLDFPRNTGIQRLPASPPLGKVLCICQLKDCIPTHDIRSSLSSRELALGNYANGRFAWMLDLIAVFEDPIPAQGAQGLWNWEPPFQAGMTTNE